MTVKSVRPIGFIIALTALFVSGCSWFDRQEPPTCPLVNILKDASRMTKFKSGPGRDIIDIETEGKFGTIQAACFYDEDEGSLIVELAIQVLAERGPASESGASDFTIFVATIDENDNVSQKSLFTKAVEFERGFRTAGAIEEIVVGFPGVGFEDGDKLQVLIGFQLSRSQLRFNRERQGR